MHNFVVDSFSSMFMFAQHNIIIGYIIFLLSDNEISSMDGLHMIFRSYNIR